MPDYKTYRNFQYVSRRHAGRISGISAATRKCLIATCSDDASDSSVRIWNYKTRKLLLHQYFPGLQRPNAVSVHPSGNELIVGFDDNVRVYHILASEMKQSHQINVKCMMLVYKKVRRSSEHWPLFLRHLAPPCSYCNPHRNLNLVVILLTRYFSPQTNRTRRVSFRTSW